MSFPFIVPTTGAVNEVMANGVAAGGRVVKDPSTTTVTTARGGRTQTALACRRAGPP